MRHFNTTILAMDTTYVDVVTSEPYECAWASEAIVFVRALQGEFECSAIVLNPQLSADGVNWVDEGQVSLELRESGEYFMRLTHFGGWLRIVGEISGGNRTAGIRLTVALKE